MMKIRLHIILVLSVFTFCSTPKAIIETKLIKGIIHDAYDIPQEGGEIAVKGTDRKVISDTNNGDISYLL